MADYHPLIARAVAGLLKNTGDERRKLYERARTALVSQLRGVVPALDESEITRERLALEEAIRKVEADSARHARESARPTVSRRLDVPSRSEPLPPPAPEEPRPSAPRAVTPPPRSPEPPVSLRPPVAPPPPGPSPAESAPPGEWRAPAPPSDERPAPRNDRAEETPNEPKRTEPSRAEPEVAPPPTHVPAPPAPTPAERHPLADYGSLEPQVAADGLWALPLDGTPPAQAPETERAPPPRAPPQRELFRRGLPEEPRQEARDEQPQEARRAPREEPRQEESRQESHPEEGGEGSPLLPTRSRGGLIGIGIIVAVIALLAGLGYWQWTPIKNVVTGFYAMVASSGSAQRQAATQAQPKITDRIGQPGPQAAGTTVQRVVLYEEDPEDPQGKRFTGTVNWKTEMKSVTPGRSPELVVRADIEIPERKMGVTWTLRRNTDPSLPASHTIELVFNLPPDSPTGGVNKVPGVLMKQSEQTRGLPLAGVAAEMPPAYFLIGLSSVESDVARNIQLLKERSWFDIPIVYKNNRRAILAMEKGPPGEKAFNDAFTAWKQ